MPFRRLYASARINLLAALLVLAPLALLAPFALSQTRTRNTKPAPLPLFSAPAGDRQAVVAPGGVTILPNGRLLTPSGARLYTGEDLWNVALRPDGRVVVGFFDRGLAVYRPGDPGAPRMIPFKNLAPVGVFTRDSQKLIVSDGDDGHVLVLDASGWETPCTPDENKRHKVEDARVLASIPAGEDAYINDLALSPDETLAYGVDVATQQVVVFDLVEKKVIARTPAGRQPYALSLSTDGKRLFVANIGLFDYSLVGKPDDPTQGSPRGISRPAFGFPGPDSERGVRFEGRNVPGLGSPYVPDAHSVWSYDLADPRVPKRLSTVKTGLLIHAQSDSGQKAVGGSSPNALLLSGNTLFVSNANNDTVQFFDAATLKLKRTVRLAPAPALAGLRGVIPTGMSLSRDGATLFVCEAGINAVAVIDTRSGSVQGHLPTGWFPVQCKLAPDQKTLFVVTQKGLGRGPRGAKTPRPVTDERYGLPDMPGMINEVALSLSKDALATSTRQVLQNNGLVPLRQTAQTRSSIPPQIEYVVFITKENHTFDGIFGEMKSRGADGEPDYAEFGRRGWLREKGKDSERLPIMPNHLNLAEQWAISDNFYMEPQASGDGHRWLVGVYPSLWTTRVFYSGWRYKASMSARGRLTSFGSNGSQIPEDYLENGSLWEHLNRGGITFRNWGEGFEFPGADEGVETARSGTFEPINFPMPKVLYDNTCFEFPIFNTNIPDIARVEWFKEDLASYRKAHGGKIPRFLNITYCNDHGAGARPDRGYPFVASYMADNDLALGRTIEYLSRLPEWKKMLVVVTEDDSGGDDDHVDRHRSFVLAIGPYVKRGYISHRHTSILSIHKTIYTLFGLGPNNLFDAVTGDLSDMFTSTPDFTPYTHTPSDPRVFKPEATRDLTDPKFIKRRAEKPPVKLDDPEFVEWLRTRK